MRTLKIKGIDGLNVWDPHAQSERHLGKDPNGACIEQEVQDHSDTRRAVKKGSLLAADEATARLCGVAWTPSPARAPVVTKG